MQVAEGKIVEFPYPSEIGAEPERKPKAA